MDNEHIVNCLSFAYSNVKYAYTHPALDNNTHIIDHFLVNNALFRHIKGYCSIHEGDNVSFHEPIVLKLDFTVDYFK